MSELESGDEKAVRLVKRTSPNDYYDGYVTALRTVREMIEQAIVTAEEARAVAQQMANDKKPPE